MKRRAPKQEDDEDGRPLPPFALHGLFENEQRMFGCPNCARKLRLRGTHQGSIAICYYPNDGWTKDIWKANIQAKKSNPNSLALVPSSPNFCRMNIICPCCSRRVYFVLGTCLILTWVDQTDGYQDPFCDLKAP